VPFLLPLPEEASTVVMGRAGRRGDGRKGGKVRLLLLLLLLLVLLLLLL